MSRPKRLMEERITTAVRLPLGLHERLQRTAHERDTSVTHLIVKATELYLDRLPPLDIYGDLALVPSPAETVSNSDAQERTGAS